MHFVQNLNLNKTTYSFLVNEAEYKIHFLHVREAPKTNTRKEIQIGYISYISKLSFALPCIFTSM